MRRQPATTRDPKHRVAGEDPRVLLPLLQRLADSMVQNDDGTSQVHVTYGKDEAPPLVRARMRWRQSSCSRTLGDSARLRTHSVHQAIAASTLCCCWSCVRRRHWDSRWTQGSSSASGRAGALIHIEV
jgi:hypothetical protein